MDLTTSKTVAAIEAGGTKFAVAIGLGDQIGRRVTIPTTDPNTTLSAVVYALQTQLHTHALTALSLTSTVTHTLNTTHPPYADQRHAPPRTHGRTGAAWPRASPRAGNTDPGALVGWPRADWEPLAAVVARAVLAATVSTASR